MNRRSLEIGSEASYCDRETWEDWGSRSSLSQVEEVASQSSGCDDVTSLRAERDSLARALAAERQRAATAARAHDARLAELHGVIAELVRRRAADKQSSAIPEEEVSDECESTTQPAGELDNDADQSRTEQNDTSSLSPTELPTPQEPKVDHELPEDTTDASTHEVEDSVHPPVAVSPAQEYDMSLNLSERDSVRDSASCVSSRCWQAPEGSEGSCERERGSPGALYTTPPGCEARQAKMAARVRLRRTEETDSNNVSEHSWCVEAAERLSLDVCAQAEFREALAAAKEDECVWRARWLRGQAELAVARLGLARAADTARRLQCACARLEAAAGGLAAALAAADRALELYDVLLALAEARHPHHHHRSSAEAVAWQLLQRLEGDEVATIGEPLLSPGPWLKQRGPTCPPEAVSVPGAVPPGARWGAAQEARLRQLAARLKADTVRLRLRAQPGLFSYHDVDEDELPEASGVFNMAEMEAAVHMEEMLSARVASMKSRSRHHDHKSESSRTRRRRERHRREARAPETDL